jgi:hypothetical protein
MTTTAIVQRKAHFILFATVCFAAIVLLIALLVYPKGQRLKAQHKKITELETALKEQRAMLPFYDDLNRKVNRKIPGAISCPPLETLSRKNTKQIVAVCKKIARQNHLKLTSVVPNIDDSDTMQVDVVFQGDFFHFRALLLALGRLPYLKRIDHFTVHSIENGREIQLKLGIARS